MPSKTGTSHTVAALLAIFLGPAIQRSFSLLVESRDLSTVPRIVAESLSENPFNPLGTGGTETLVYLGSVSVLTFVWGYFYHRSRHG